MPPRIHLLDLPLEIHSKILFVALKASFDGEDDETTCQPHINPQARLALVCRLWTNLITSVPELWTQLSINISHSSNEDIPRWLDHASDVLSKVEYSISMRILAIGDRKPSRSVHQAIIAFIARHFDRCQVLDLRIPATCWSMIREHGFKGLVAKRLETLRIISSASFERDAKVFNLAQQAPRLTSFACDGIYMSTIKLPWGNLTNLNLEFVTVDECLSVLSQTRNLEHLSILDIVIGVEPPTAPRVLMAHLKSFAGFDYAEHGLAQLISKIDAPRLDHFWWMSEVKNDPLTLDSIKWFIGGAADLSTFVVTHNKPDELEGWVVDIWESAPALGIVVLKPDLLEFIKASTLEIGRRYCGYGIKEWGDVLLFLPCALHAS